MKTKIKVPIIVLVLSLSIIFIGCGPTLLNIPRPIPDPPRELMLSKQEEPSGITIDPVKLAKADAEYGKAKATSDHDSLLRARTLYEEAGAFSTAAKLSLELSSTAGNTAGEAREKIEAAKLFQLGAEYDKAASIFKDIARDDTYSRLGYPVSGDYKTFGEVSLFQLGLTYEMMGKWKDALKTYQKFNEKYADRLLTRIEANYRIGWVSRYLEQDDVAKESFGNSFELFDSAPGIMSGKLVAYRSIAFNGRFQNLEYDYYEFEGYDLVLPQSKMEENLTKRMDISQYLIAEYTDFLTDTTHDEIEWQFIVLLRAADVYYDFARAIENAEIPKDIHPDNWQKLEPNDPKRITAEQQYNAYIDELEGQVNPLDAKALEYYQIAIKMMKENNLEGPWADRARMMIGELNE